MKIGILTLPLNINYGGVLQAYALSTVLKKQGHDTFIIEKTLPTDPWWKLNLFYIKRIFRKFVLRKKGTEIFIEKRTRKEYPIITQHFQSFITQYIPRAITKSYEEVLNDNLNAIVVGSDQIWRPKYFSGDIKDTFLAFANGWDIKRIAYAASFGTDQWEYTETQTNECKELIKKFNAVSVRESSGVGLCAKYLDIKAQQVLDPTLLLKKEDYIRLINGADTTKPKGKVYAYILDSTEPKMKLLENIKKQLHVESFSIKTTINDRNIPVENRILTSIEQWLRNFNEAEFIVTDSFHGCIFSIIFNKPFIVYGNTERGYTRFTSLLSTFELTDRLIVNPDDISDIATKPINWENVNLLLKKEQEKSFLFLDKALN